MRKNIINLENHGLRELDRIVVNVLDAVETEVRNRLGLDDYWEATAETEENQNLSADQPTSEEESVAGPTAKSSLSISCVRPVGRKSRHLCNGTISVLSSKLS